jgi:hypothetical protein
MPGNRSTLGIVFASIQNVNPQTAKHQKKHVNIAFQAAQLTSPKAGMIEEDA